MDFAYQEYCDPVLECVFLLRHLPEVDKECSQARRGGVRFLRKNVPAFLRFCISALIPGLSKAARVGRRIIMMAANAHTLQFSAHAHSHRHSSCPPASCAPCSQRLAAETARLHYTPSAVTTIPEGALTGVRAVGGEVFREPFRRIQLSERTNSIMAMFRRQFCSCL